MKVFLCCSYSAKVNFDTGEVLPEFKEKLEGILTTIESTGATAFNALRADGYRINEIDPADAFFLDKNNIDDSDVLLVLLEDVVSAGVQVEIGYGIAKGKRVILAYEPGHKLQYFNDAMIRAGVVEKLVLPLTTEKLKGVLGQATSANTQ